ncbi:hypothetical protein THAOC_30463 [Thalassiosira oceanica]|uniref:Uncharacterized protein n=1 Tax=Thalassiosira oceanica TaxID=159749 RepID=K0RE62_THAOC|nr:hypothetical protein THAOC_30463 [Thalassiosira oceanica]|eukprot:EJK50534.1 hypothetical protein THAOC_30463 [Thalassiosira oceanica]
MNLSFLFALAAAVGTVPPSAESREVQHDDGTSVGSGGDRGLQSFATCDSDKECDAVIARYTRAEALDIIETVLKSVANQPGCLDQDDRVSPGCGLSDNCQCGFCFFGSLCFATVCVDECYDNSLKPTVDEMVRYGVEIRKVCASCDEEHALLNPATDQNSLGYCDGYAKDATVSGLLILPLDDDGAMPRNQLTASVWSRTTTSETCGSGLPSEFSVDKLNPTGVSVNALVAMIVGASGSVSIAPDGVGFGESSDFYKGEKQAALGT